MYADVYKHVANDNYRLQRASKLHPQMWYYCFRC